MNKQELRGLVDDAMWCGHCGAAVNILCEAVASLLPEPKEKRYKILVAPGERGFLNRDTDDGRLITSSERETNIYQTIFTESEIEELKKVSDLNIDWDNALREVKDE